MFADHCHPYWKIQLGHMQLVAIFLGIAVGTGDFLLFLEKGDYFGHP
jgi:hypothetical protein